MYEPLVQWLFVWSLILLIIATRDETHYILGKKDIPAWFRLLIQIIAIIVAIYIGNIWIDERVFKGMIVPIPQRLFVLFFVIRSMICINAINRFDGVYGQASGVSSIWFLTTFLLIQFVVLPYYTTITPDNEAVLNIVKNISYIGGIATLVYTVIEYKPLGLVRDLGTMICGFMLAYLSIVGWVKIGTLVVALSLVIFDAIWVALHRVFVLKKSPLKGDYTHLHYRLLGLWRTRGEVRAFVRWWSLVMMVIMIMQDTDRSDKLIIFFVMALIFFGVNAYLFRIKKLPCGLQVKK